ncbi:MAG TPA: restriction endonuclease [Nitrospira sp.]|nr:restriction endonuclease [Nitrospira sp.]
MPKQPAESSRLPSGGEFSPNQIDLGEVLRIVAKSDGDRDAAVEALRVKYFATAAADRKDPAERLEQQRKRAGNVLIGMATYGLIEAGVLSDIGAKLVKENAQDRSRAFARHILRSRNGMKVLAAVRNLTARGHEPTKGSIAAELESLGLQMPRATTHHLVLLAWLRKAGVLVGDRGYEINDKVVADLAGVSLEVSDAWAGLTNAQRAVVRVLRNLATTHGDQPQPAQHVVELAEQEYGHIFGARDQLRKHVFAPLEKAGWIAMSGSSGGRGAKSGMMAATQKLVELDILALPAAVSSDIPADLRLKLNTPLAKIYADLFAIDAYTKGIALELLAVNMATDLNITPRRLRLRGVKTAGAEVDLIAEAAHLHFSRWLFQCKNAPSVDVSDLAKEVGMAVLLKAHVIVIVTTGTIGAVVRRYAKALSAETTLQAVLIDSKIVDSYRKHGAATLLDYFHNTASQTLQIKRPQAEDDSD